MTTQTHDDPPAGEQGNPDPAAAAAAAGANPAAAGAGAASKGAFGQAAAAGLEPVAVPPLAERIPEKYRVLKEDGTLDVEASAGKVTDAHAALEKKLGAGDVAPKTPEDYAPTVEGIDFAELKKDPLYQSFLKGAHAKGITNAQLEFVISEYAARADEDVKVGLSDDEFQAEMAKHWTGPDGYKKGMDSGIRAVRAFMPEATAEDIASIPNVPFVARLLERIGKEVGEDHPVIAGGASVANWESQVSDLRASPEYNDAKHAKHKEALAKMEALYANRYGTKKQVLSVATTGKA